MFGAVTALQQMTFDVRAGELFGFVGSNGAGKTTAMRIALGVLTSDAGEVRWDGEPITFATRRRIGYMPEERGLYPRMKVGEQLGYLGRLHGMTRKAARDSATAWMERLGVAERRNDDVLELSLGNQQRVQLAGALVHDPAILILDEPFSGLDPVAVDVMRAVLAEKRDQGVPVVFSSHQLDLVERLCDRVGIVSRGQMVAVGSVADLQDDGNAELVVEAPSAVAGWADDVDDVVRVEFDRGRWIVELAPGADEQRVLRAALGTGAVREFSRRRQPLSELFRDVVNGAEHGNRRPDDPGSPDNPADSGNPAASANKADAESPDTMTERQRVA